MDHSRCDGAADHGEEEASDGQRHGDGDGGSHGLGGVGAAVDGDNHQNGGGDGGESRIRSDGSADVGPTKGNHLKRAAQEDSLRGVTGHKTNERACDQRLVELPLVEDALHACQEGNNNHEQD